jgi:hypothetical protein
MSKIIHTPNFPSEYSVLKKKIETLERSFLLSTLLTEINTTGLTDAQIDEQVAGGRGTPENGKPISDPTNKLFLLRQKGKWKRVSVE